jgi:hypothetical protein
LSLPKYCQSNPDARPSFVLNLDADQHFEALPQSLRGSRGGRSSELGQILACENSNRSVTFVHDGNFTFQSLNIKLGIV